MAELFAILNIAVFVLSGVALTIVDCYFLRLPNRLIAAGLLLCVATAIPHALAAAEPERLFAAVGGSALAALQLLPLRLLAAAQLGMGDVKLGFLLGWQAGYWAGWWGSTVALLLASLLLGCAALVVVLRRARASLSQASPAAPQRQAGGSQHQLAAGPARASTASPTEFAAGPWLLAATLLTALWGLGR